MSAFCALTLLVLCHEKHLACKVSYEVVLWLYVWSKVLNFFAYGPADATAMFLNPIISCLIKIQTGFTFLVPAWSGCPGKEAVEKWLSVSV